MKYLFAILIFMFMISSALAIEELSPVKKNECVNLPQTCVSCTYNNITVIQYPNKTYALRGEYAMTKVGMTYNLTFCNTTELGTYFVDGHGDLEGTDTGWGGYTFVVSGSGQEVSQPQTSLLIMTLAILILPALFFFVLSFVFKHPGTKIFFMAISTITLVVVIGLITSNAETYLAEFPNLVSIYNSYYLFIITGSGAAMLALIVWFIYYALTMFNKSRGRIPDDD